jgi:hypothetical protein
MYILICLVELSTNITFPNHMNFFLRGEKSTTLRLRFSESASKTELAEMFLGHLTIIIVRWPKNISANSVFDVD